MSSTRAVRCGIASGEADVQPPIDHAATTDPIINTMGRSRVFMLKTIARKAQESNPPGHASGDAVTAHR